MNGRPAGTLTGRFRTHIAGWLTAAALAAIALLPGTIVEGAFASNSSTPIVADDLYVAADPTPTPTPAATATPPEPAPPREVTAYVGASSVIDRDGKTGSDPEELDWQWVSGWRFVADFGTAQVDRAQPISEEGGDASWEITYEADTPVVITEQVPDGHRLIDVRCQWSPDDMTVAPLPVTRDHNTISWTAPVGTWFEHGFWCIFVNVVDGTKAQPTLPQTDTATRYAAPESDAWRIVLVGLASLIAGVLVLGSRPTAPGRR